MTTKKHNLTTGKDHIAGTGGVDLFLGKKGALGSNDVLNGGGGIDTISAELSGKHVAPVMKNIEKGIFTHQGFSPLGLDLLHAQQMRSLAVKNFEADATFKNATHVSSIAMRNIDGHDMLVKNIDTDSVGTEKMSFAGLTEQRLDVQTIGHETFDKIDIALKNSQIALEGDLSRELVLHSLSKQPSSLTVLGDDASPTIAKITIDGSAALDFYLTQAESQVLSSFDAGNMNGALTTTLDSNKLGFVRGGTDNDDFFINHLGGDQVHKADLDMGAGDDRVEIDTAVFNNSTMVLNGATGRDTLAFSGVDSGITLGTINFEVLQIEKAAGTYTLNSDWQEVDIVGGASSNAGLVLTGGVNLTMIKGGADSDYIQVDDLGGTTDHKARIALGGGADLLRVETLALDPGTQHFDGGKGIDYFVVTGNVPVIADLFTNFEFAYIKDAFGSYDFTDSGVNRISLLQPPAGAMTLNGLHSGSLIDIGSTQQTIMTVNVEDAAALKDESLFFTIGGNADVGNANFGLIAPDLSSLHINSIQGAHTFYLSQIGSATDLATLTVQGDSKLTLVAANASTSYIDQIVVTNTAGLDMLGLLDGSKALASSGVSITGGTGADVLVGGVGADTIAGGAGDDKIHGSLGIDDIDLTGGGQDMLIFHAVDQSAFFSGDDIVGFNIFSGIDISDVVSSIAFGGNVADFNAGVAKLSNSHSVAFFDTSSHTLYVDANHDGTLNSAHDMEFHLAGLDTFASTSLIG